ncbi:MAG: polysaccharide pyruvyl transferase family protein [Calothrix sp. MO_192.B10]|nr:polysaccharide pyruvyl transferase family protein [Calothrix sp. MO_192.B10]
MNILLMGYYGFKNIGDDLFVTQLVNYLSNQEYVEHIFLFCQQDYYEFTSNKVVILPTDKLSKSKRLSIILQSDYIIWGGGSLNLQGKPKNLLRLQKIAKITRKKFCFIGVGLETIQAGDERSKYPVFQNADFLYLRDNYSYDLAIKKLKLLKSCHLGGDLAFLNLDLYNLYIKQKEKSNQIKNISFTGKFWWGEGRAEFYAQQLMQFVYKYHSVIHLLPAHMGDERNDNRFHKLLIKYLPEANYRLYSWDKPGDFLEILSNIDFHIGNRLHSIILADILGVPNIGIGDTNSKIGHYINKTKMLSQERVLEFMEPLEATHIEKIFQQYHRPDEFIFNEFLTAQKGLELMLMN